MRKWLDRYYGSLRKVKFNYVLLNLFNLRKLRHARRMYRKYGITRSVLLPISSADLPRTSADVPWLDRPDGAQAMASAPAFQRFDAATREALSHWPERGYVILRGLFSPEEVAAINAEVDRLIREKVVDFNFTGRKVMFAFHHSQLLRTAVHDRRILDVMDFLLGKRMQVFQSINFLTGSEQAAHSDSIHMTTYPLGYMSAAWIALERMTPDNGPLIYHPGSHKLPYLLNGSYDHGGNRFVIGEDAYARYEEAVDKAVAEGRFDRVEFLAQPGDVLIWHANLLHGGKRMTVPNASRKSMVIHCFADDVLCYHELTQRAALMDDHD
ncbi:MAG: phytanoyl-CoA dioxygenase family protein [Bacteroidetes bacterium]|nr:phytanoyl-CoA dioxygenase family protein [Bacteroidota bacterium]